MTDQEFFAQRCETKFNGRAKGTKNPMEWNHYTFERKLLYMSDEEKAYLKEASIASEKNGPLAWAKNKTMNIIVK